MTPQYKHCERNGGKKRSTNGAQIDTNTRANRPHGGGNGNKGRVDFGGYEGKVGLQANKKYIRPGLWCGLGVWVHEVVQRSKKNTRLIKMETPNQKGGELGMRGWYYKDNDVNEIKGEHQRRWYGGKV